MTRLLLGLTALACLAFMLSFFFEQINAGQITDFWPGAIFVVALIVAGAAMYVIKTSRRANRWRFVRTIRRWLARMDRKLQKDQRNPPDRFSRATAFPSSLLPLWEKVPSRSEGG